MTWLIFIFAGLVIFGSVYWLKPSPRDTRLANLRLDAIKLGLQVRQQTFKVDAAKTGIRDDIAGTSYTLMRALSHSDKQTDSLKYRLVGQSGWETDGLSDGLAWHDWPAMGLERETPAWHQANQAVADRVLPLLEALQDDLLLLEVFENRVTLMVAERKSASAEGYHALLEALLSDAGSLR